MKLTVFQSIKEHKVRDLTFKVESTPVPNGRNFHKRFYKEFPKTITMKDVLFHLEPDYIKNCVLLKAYDIRYDKNRRQIMSTSSEVVIDYYPSCYN